MTCITSSISVELGKVSDAMFQLKEVKDVGVIFRLATGKKCNRCWKYVKSIGDVEMADTCTRCTNVLTSYS